MIDEASDLSLDELIDALRTLPNTQQLAFHWYVRHIALIEELFCDNLVTMERIHQLMDHAKTPIDYYLLYLFFYKKQMTDCMRTND